jgi:hypothetical protein
MCGGGGGGGGGESRSDRRERKERERKMDRQREEDRRRAEADQARLEQKQAAFAAEQARIAAIPPAQARQNMSYSLSRPGAPGDSVAPINPGTGVNETFDLSVAPPTLVNNNVKPTIKTNSVASKRKSAKGSKLTIDKNNAIGTGKGKQSATGLNIPT